MSSVPVSPTPPQANPEDFSHSIGATVRPSPPSPGACPSAVARSPASISSSTLRGRAHESATVANARARVRRERRQESQLAEQEREVEPETDGDSDDDMANGA